MRASAVRSVCRWRSGESVWCANAVTNAAGSDSSRTDSTRGFAINHAECRGFHRRAHFCAESRGWLLDEFKFREEVWLRRTRTPRDAWRPADQGIDGVPGSLKPVYAPSDDSTVAVRSCRKYSLLGQDAETVRQPVLFIWSIRSVWFVWLH